MVALAELARADPARAQAALGASAPPRPRFARPGLTASAGTGTQYAGVGLQLLYALPVPRRNRSVSPWNLCAGVGAGHFRTIDGSFTYDRKDIEIYGVAALVGASFGYRHRLTLDVGYGTVATQNVAIEGLVVDAAAHKGPFAEIGYEFVGASGISVRFLPVGILYVPTALVGSDRRWGYAASVGFGWKVW